MTKQISEKLTGFINSRPQYTVLFRRTIDGSKQPHTHLHPLFVLPIRSTAVEIHVKGHKQVVDSDSFVLIPANVTHEDHCLSSIYEAFGFALKTDTFDAILAEFNSSPHSFQLGSHLFKKSEWMKECLKRYYHLRFRTSMQNEKELQLIEELIIREAVRIMTPICEVEKTEFVARNINDLIEALEANLFADLSIQKISKFASKSRSALFREFIDVVGCSPMEFVTRRRMEEAKTLLQTGSHNVSEVSLLVGYQTAAAFSRAFKKIHGHSPAVVMPKKIKV